MTMTLTKNIHTSKRTIARLKRLRVKHDALDDVINRLIDEHEGKKARNPAHYCHCGKYIGQRGFCSQKCHDEYHDETNR